MMGVTNAAAARAAVFLTLIQSGMAVTPRSGNLARPRPGCVEG